MKLHVEPMAGSNLAKTVTLAGIHHLSHSSVSSNIAKESSRSVELPPRSVLTKHGDVHQSVAKRIEGGHLPHGKSIVSGLGNGKEDVRRLAELLQLHCCGPPLPEFLAQSVSVPRWS
jgi:hypothetical protein